MTRKVLLVDDEENVLAGYHRVLRRRFEMDVALGGPQALQAMEGHGPYAVLVADMQMPGMNGVELLQKAQERYPDTIRVMLTGNLDQRTAMDAINQGRVFRFLTKPCTPEELGQVLDAGIRQYDLERAERELLEHTLTGSLKVLTEILSVSVPEAFGRAGVVRDRALWMAEKLGVVDSWEIGVAAMMSPLGLVTVPPSLLARDRAEEVLSAKERETLQRVPEFGAGLLERIPRLEGVARAVRYQRRHYAGGGYPQEGPTGEEIPLAARILHVLSDFVDIEDRRGSRVVALEHLKLRMGWYDPQILAMLELFCGQVPESPAQGPRLLPVGALEPGMLLAADVKTRMGMLVVCGGTRLLASHVEKLQNFAKLIGLEEPIQIQGEG